jgi:uncharacterized protein
MLTTLIPLMGTYSFDAPRDTVFAALIDPTVIQRCIDVCEKIVMAGDDSYDAHSKIGAAGLRGSYVAKMLEFIRKPSVEG